MAVAVVGRRQARHGLLLYTYSSCGAGSARACCVPRGHGHLVSISFPVEITRIECGYRIRVFFCNIIASSERYLYESVNMVSL